jgi:hypothetical protein
VHHHHHDDDVKSFVYRAERAFDPAKLEDFLGAIVNIYGPRMLRYKGVLHMKGTERKVIFQGVHQLMGSDLGPQWAEGEKRQSKMVFIGIDLPRTSWSRAWTSAWSPDAAPAVWNAQRLPPSGQCLYNRAPVKPRAYYDQTPQVAPHRHRSGKARTARRQDVNAAPSKPKACKGVCRGLTGPGKSQRQGGSSVA